MGFSTLILNSFFILAWPSSDVKLSLKWIAYKLCALDIHSATSTSRSRY